MAWWSSAQGSIINGYGTTDVGVHLCSQTQGVRPILQPPGQVTEHLLCVHSWTLLGWAQLLTGNHPSPRLLWERYQDVVWERERWHGRNCQSKQANSSPAWIFIHHLLTQCRSSVWFTGRNAAREIYAKNIVYQKTATGLVTGMSYLISMLKRNWTNWTNLCFWTGQPKSVVSCRQRCPCITDAYRQYAEVLVLLGMLQLLFPE